MKKIVCLIFCFAFLIPVCGCEKKQDYTLEYSFVDLFDFEQYALSDLPWFSTYEEACDLLEINELSEKDYKLSETADRKELTLYNVKLTELPYPFTLFTLVFQKDPQADEAYTFDFYAFTMESIDGKTVEVEKEEAYQEQEASWFQLMKKMYQEAETVYSPFMEKSATDFFINEEPSFNHVLVDIETDGHGKKDVRCEISPTFIRSRIVDSAESESE